MGKLVIVAKCMDSGQKAVFQSIDEAGKAIGVTGSSISLACVENRPTSGWICRRAERVFAVRLKAHNLWMVCVLNAHGKYVEFGNPLRRVDDREYDEVRDITVGWYLQDMEGMPWRSC